MKTSKSFLILYSAARKSREPMWQVIKVLLCITVILAIIFFCSESLGQPKNYSGPIGLIKSFVWAFLQYVRMPERIAGPGPVTVIGKIVAVIIGLLNILVFAIPAGMIGSNYSSAMREERRAEQIEHYRNKLLRSFRTIQDGNTLFQVVPRYLSMVTIQTRQGLDIKDILAVVNHTTNFRLRNLAITYDRMENPQDRMVVEYFPYQLSLPGAEVRSYGTLINRHSKVTIVSTSSVSEMGSGFFAYYLALFGGFNYISKEFEKDADNPVSYYNISLPNGDEANQQLFLDDIKHMGMGEDQWVVCILSVPRLSNTQFHFVHRYKDDLVEKLGVETSVLPDKESTFNALCQEFTECLQQVKYPLAGDAMQYPNAGRLDADIDKIYRLAGPKNIATHLGGGREVNVFTIRILNSITARDSRAVSLIYTLAGMMKQKFTGEVIKQDEEDAWKHHAFGYDKIMID